MPKRTSTTPSKDNHYRILKQRATTDPKIILNLFEKTITAFLNKDHKTGKTILRHLIHSTIGFKSLADEMKMSSKSLHRMVGPNGNPLSENFFTILSILQQKSQVRIKIVVQSNTKSRNAL